MSAFTLVFTDAGRAALINAAQTGTEKRTVVSAGMTNTPFTATATMTTLPGEIKRIDAVSGAAIAPDQISLGILDTGTDTYTVTGFGLYLDNDVLLAVYSQATPLLVKTESSFSHLQVDVLIKDASIQAGDIKFGDMVFLNPVATETMEGVARIATQTEVDAGTDDKTILTPKKLSATLTNSLATSEDIQNGTAGKLIDASGLATTQKTFKMNVLKFEGSGTYTPSKGVQVIVVEAVGGGGAGGGATVTKTGDVSIGAGGGAGGACKSKINASDISSSIAVTIGAGGIGNAGAKGGDGGTTSFGTFLNATGGDGGVMAGPASVSFGFEGGFGGIGKNGNINNAVGGRGGGCFVSIGSYSFAGNGGASAFSAGGWSYNRTNGGDASGYGAGGGGSEVSGGYTGIYKGGNGASGVVVITEYILE